MKYIFGILFLFTSFFCASYAQKNEVLATKKMCIIPKGNYKPFFVTKNNKPLEVAAFKMDEYAVTNAEFLEFVKANPTWTKSKVNRLFADTNYLRYWEGDTVIGIKNKNIHHSPVVNVSWFAAQAYCKWKKKRLPTVAEWELAGNGLPKSNKISSLTEYILGWYKKPNLPVLPNVKTTYQNALGLYDMHGLIWEWTFNFNSFIGNGDSRGNTEDEQKAFCAAGSINVNDRKDYAGFLRFSYRGSLKGNYCIANLGFRCAMDIN